MSNDDTRGAAATVTETPDDAPLYVEGFKGSPEEVERQWFEKVYKGRGDVMPQLTWRAVLMGVTLGGIMSLTNLYIGLKAGWGFGVAITACIISYAVWEVFMKIGLAKRPMTILENNCMQSAASSSGYSTGATLVSAFAAYIMINNASLPTGLMMGWIFFVAVLGVTMAVPMKRQMINVEQLRFPSGIAAAETLRALHSKGSQAMRSARALGIAGIAAALTQFWIDGLHLVSAKLAPFGLGELMNRFNKAVFGPVWMGRTVFFNFDPIFIAAGALTGLRVAGSMFVGGTLCWAVFVPALQSRGIVTSTAYRDIVQWTLWGGTSCMVTAGLLSFFMQWRMILRALGGLARIFGKGVAPENDDMAAIETPFSWFAVGQIVSLVGLVWLAKVTFQMPVWQSVVAVLLTFFLALVACRVTGETDTTPIGAMGKVTQLLFGVISPGNINVNLMSANITANAAIASADLLTDLKSGYLLGANPRKQFLAQFSGIFVGTVVTVLAFKMMVPDASVLGTDRFPAPAAQTWRAVALALSHGLASLGALKAWSIAIGSLVGIVLTVLPRILPRHAKWMPSAAAVGLSWTFHWYYSLLFLIGAVFGEGVKMRRPEWSKDYTFPVASGIIAGGSLMGVLLVFWENGASMFRQIFGHG
jgi:putative OPT family oligopeptide transporter